MNVWLPPPPKVDPDGQHWLDRAACKGYDTDLFFPDKSGHPKWAIKICAGCPVRQECLDYAIEAGCRFGVYGGYTSRQREALTAIGYWPGRRLADYLPNKVTE